MKKVTLLLVTGLICFSCNDSKEIDAPDIAEVKVFKNSSYMSNAENYGLNIDFESAEVSSDDSGKMLTLDVLKTFNSGRLNSSYSEYIVVSFDEGNEINGSFLVSFGSEPIEGYSGSISLSFYDGSGDSSTIELENGQISLNELNGRIDICGSSRQVLYCAAESIDNKEGLEYAWCVVTVAACWQKALFTCLLTGCPK